jgi:hypothetical protein
VQVGQALDRIGERLLVDLGVLGANPLSDGLVGDSREFGSVFNCRPYRGRRNTDTARSCSHGCFHLILQSAKLLQYESANDI